MHPKPVQTKSTLLPSDQDILRTRLNRNHPSLIVLKRKRNLSHCAEGSVGAAQCSGSSRVASRLPGVLFWKQCVYSPSQVGSQVDKLFPMLTCLIHFMELEAGGLLRSSISWFIEMPCLKGIRWRVIEHVTWPCPLASTGMHMGAYTHILTCIYITHTGKKWIAVYFTSCKQLILRVGHGA